MKRTISISCFLAFFFCFWTTKTEAFALAKRIEIPPQYETSKMSYSEAKTPKLKDESDLEIWSTAALTVGILSFIAFLTLTFAGVVVPTLLSLVLGVSSLVQALRVLKNVNATTKQKKRARWGLAFSITTLLGILLFLYWLFSSLA